MACLWAKDPPKLEDLLPPDEAARAAIEESPDERTMRKLDSVMLQYGGTVSTDRSKAQQDPAEDEYTRKMWRLMGVTE